MRHHSLEEDYYNGPYIGPPIPPPYYQYNNGFDNYHGNGQHIRGQPPPMYNRDGKYMHPNARFNNPNVSHSEYNE